MTINRELSFSRRVEALDDAMSIRINTLVYERRARGEEVTVLSLGEAFFDIPLADFGLLPYPAIHHYSHSRGLPALREILSRYLLDTHAVSIDPASEIVLTAGSKIAIQMALLAILDAGDEAIVFEPAWVSYTEQVKLCDAVPVCVPHDHGPEELEPYLTPRTKLIILNHPNNPSGYVYTPSQLAQLSRLARERGLWLLCDEAYSDFVPGGRFNSAAASMADRDHTVVVNSISKNCALSGWRVGYILGSREFIDRLLILNQHLVTCAPTILQHYLVANYADILAITRPQIAELLELRADVAAHMDALGLEYMSGTATFYFCVSIAPSTLDSLAFCLRLLDEEGISAVPGIGYGRSCDGFIRIGIGTTPRDELLSAIDRIKQLIERTKAGS